MTSPLCSTAIVADGKLIEGDLDASAVLWWSFTKTVLAAATLTLARDGKLNLDAPLDDASYTLRQLLCHTAGVPNYSDLDSYAPAVTRKEQPWTPEDMLARVQHARLLFAPGQGWRYSNTGYFLVRRLIESVTGNDLENALQQLLFTPLGIGGVSLAAVPADLDATAWGNPDGYHPGWVYHGLLIGPPAAAALLLDRLLTGDHLPPALLAGMIRQYPLGHTLPRRPGIDFGYGMGLMIARNGPAGPSVGHTGAGPVSVAAVYRFPDHGRTVATFAPVADEAVVEWAAHEGANKIANKAAK